MWRVWAGVASVVGGVLVAAAFGGAPRWSVSLILALCIVGGATVLITRIRVRARRRRTAIPASDPEVDIDAAEHDRVLVSEVCRLVSRSDVAWLARHDFVAPWRKRQVEPWSQLLDLRARGHYPRHPELDRAYDSLIRATASFMDAHDRNTFRDRLVVADDWRDIGWSMTDESTINGKERDIFDRRRALLNDRAAAVLDEYAAFLDTARRIVGL